MVRGAGGHGGWGRASPASPSVLAIVEHQLILEWVQGHQIGREQGGIKCQQVRERTRAPPSLVALPSPPFPLSPPSSEFLMSKSDPGKFVLNGRDSTRMLTFRFNFCKKRTELRCFLDKTSSKRLMFTLCGPWPKSRGIFSKYPPCPNQPFPREDGRCGRASAPQPPRRRGHEQDPRPGAAAAPFFPPSYCSIAA